jgi:hypothetical protein
MYIIWTFHHKLDTFEYTLGDSAEGHWTDLSIRKVPPGLKSNAGKSVAIAL